jgi:site-specific recombinase XerD
MPRASYSPATRNAYAADWRDFSVWCRLHGVSALPASASTLRLYFRQLAVKGAKAATIARRAAAISTAHRLAGTDPPTREETVRATLAVIRRTIGTAKKPRAGISIEELHRMVAVCDPGTKAGLRDRALLVLACAGPFRRSELVALDVKDLEHTPDGLRIQVRRSGTDEERVAKFKILRYSANPSTCPVRTLSTWLRAAKITQGPVFRPVKRYDKVQPHRLTDESVALIVKRVAARAGLEPGELAADSLRRALSPQGQCGE